MLGKSYFRISLLILPLAGLACNQKLTATQIQHERMDVARANPRHHFAYMMDNAMAADMAIVDFHFVSHTSELSGAGAARLDRMAHYLNAYGGTVRYDTSLTDEELIRTRLERVREYLAAVGCDMDRVEATTMISGGSGSPADRAIEYEENLVAPPKEETSSSGFLSGAGS
ncbi:MAG: hypothetical protein JSU63_21185 [Phycisphaerales bacterium]|nr:MAG: hypothetical protein JSU63_21185 [Phycisphaerales bacterium]